MINLNSITITGNVSASPETSPVGQTTVTRARLMHNNTVFVKDGEDKEELVAIDIEIWGKRGEAFAEMITTKSPVYIAGRMCLDQWKDKASQEPRSRLFIRVNDWQFVLPKAAPANGTE